MTLFRVYSHIYRTVNGVVNHVLMSATLADMNESNIIIHCCIQLNIYITDITLRSIQQN